MSNLFDLWGWQESTCRDLRGRRPNRISYAKRKAWHRVLESTGSSRLDFLIPFASSEH